MAWVFVQYAPKISPLYGIEQQARNARVGLWADPAPMPPWEWRQVKKLGEVSR
jgi:endonuclease YncB( thermonuclease family)